MVSSRFVNFIVYQSLSRTNQDFDSRQIRMVRTQSEAKRFFVDKVVARARVERVPLSDAERQIRSGFHR